MRQSEGKMKHYKMNGAQHKRPGRKAKELRRKRAAERAAVKAAAEGKA